MRERELKKWEKYYEKNKAKRPKAKVMLTHLMFVFPQKGKGEELWMMSIQMQ